MLGIPSCCQDNYIDLMFPELCSKEGNINRIIKYYTNYNQKVKRKDPFDLDSFIMPGSLGFIKSIAHIPHSPNCIKSRKRMNRKTKLKEHPLYKTQLRNWLKKEKVVINLRKIGMNTMSS